MCCFKKILSLTFFENYYSKQTKHTPQCNLYGWDKDFQLREQLRGDLPIHTQNFEPPLSVGFHPLSKKLNPPLFLHDSLLPSLNCRPRIAKKASLIAFRQILWEILSVVRISGVIITTVLNTFIRIKSINTKQCLAEWSLGNITSVLHLLPKMSSLL